MRVQAEDRVESTLSGVLDAFVRFFKRLLMPLTMGLLLAVGAGVLLEALAWRAMPGLRSRTVATLAVGICTAGLAILFASSPAG